MGTNGGIEEATGVTEVVETGGVTGQWWWCVGKKFPNVEATLENSSVALSAALFRIILLILETLGAVLFVHTPLKKIK